MMEVRRWLVRMEWRPAELSVCLPLLSFLALSCTRKSRRRLSFLLAPAHPGSPGMWTVKRLCVCTVSISASAHGLRSFLFLLELKDCTMQTANCVCVGSECWRRQSQCACRQNNTLVGCVAQRQNVGLWPANFLCPALDL